MAKVSFVLYCSEEFEVPCDSQPWRAGDPDTLESKESSGVLTITYRKINESHFFFLFKMKKFQNWKCNCESFKFKFGK